MLDDLVAGAGRLASEPPDSRKALAERMIREAHAAHHFMRRMGRPHPVWGNGSLMTRALRDAPGPALPLCFASLALIADAIARFREENAILGHGLSQRRALCYGHDQNRGMPWPKSAQK